MRTGKRESGLAGHLLGAPYETSDCVDKRCRLDWLSKMLIETGGGGPLAVFFAREGSERNGQDVAISAVQCTNAADQNVAILLGHAEVADEEVKRVFT